MSGNRVFQHIAVVDDKPEPAEIIKERVLQGRDRGQQELEGGKGLTLAGERQFFLEMREKSGAPLAGRLVRPALECAGIGAEFAHGQHLRALNRCDGALRVHVEGTQGFELVAEKLQAHRMFHLRREQVEDSSTQGELPRLRDRIVLHVAYVVQMPAEQLRREVLPCLQFEAVRQKMLRVRQPDRGAPCRSHQHSRPVLQQLPQRLGARGGNLRVRRQSAVRVYFRARKMDHGRSLRCEDSQKIAKLPRQILGIFVVDGEDCHGAVSGQDHLSYRECPGPAGNSRNREVAGPLAHACRQLFERGGFQRVLQNRLERIYPGSNPGNHCWSRSDEAAETRCPGAARPQPRV